MKVLTGTLLEKLAVTAAVAVLAVPVQSIAAPATKTTPQAKPSVVAAQPVISSSNATYVKAKAALAKKSYKEAAKHFEAAMVEDKNLQRSCECRLNLGKSLCGIAKTLPAGAEQTTTYKKGASELRKAIRVGRGSKNAIEANAVLMSLPHSIIAPKTGDDTPMIAMANGIRGLDRGAGDASKPKILEFYASWCEPCKQLKPLMDKVKNQYGEQVEFISYNVDDPEVEKVVEDYEVSPIPTLIFLDPANQVVTYSVGYSGEAGLQKGLKKILTKPM